MAKAQSIHSAQSPNLWFASYYVVLFFFPVGLFVCYCCFVFVVVVVVVVVVLVYFCFFVVVFQRYLKVS